MIVEIRPIILKLFIGLVSKINYQIICSLVFQNHPPNVTMRRE